MKQFFSQTWVIAVLVLIVIGGIVYLAYKQKNKDENGDDNKSGDNAGK